MIPDIGSIRLGKLLEFFGKPEDTINAPREKLTRIFGIGEKIAEQIHSFNIENLEKELLLAKKYRIRIMTQDDADYPQNLKNIYDPPIVLYVKGELKPEDNLAIAVVGSRRASFYGLNSAEKFSRQLAEKGLTIVSGMARGIDTYAHQGALKAGGRTIAVIGSGFRHIYPQENMGLAEKIAQNGAVVSEFPMNTEPFKQNFPRRNRVISGLSLGTLVVEAAQNSGALITADFALEQGREVFALPGKVDSGTSFGTNGLIKQGAKLVTSPEDILEELNLETNVSGIKCHVSGENNTTIEENSLYSLLSNEPVSVDELVEKTNLAIPCVSDILLRLQLKKLVQQLPGKQFVRSSEAIT
jgi:DNA processing protein